MTPVDTILLGAVVTLLVEVGKALHKHFVKPEVEGAVIIVAGFLVSVIAVIISRVVPQQMLVTALQVWASSIATYEVVFARVIAPVLAKLFPSE